MVGESLARWESYRRESRDRCTEARVVTWGSPVAVARIRLPVTATGSRMYAPTRGQVADPCRRRIHGSRFTGTVRRGRLGAKPQPSPLPGAKASAGFGAGHLVPPQNQARAQGSPDDANLVPSTKDVSLDPTHRTSLCHRRFVDYGLDEL